MVNLGMSVVGVSQAIDSLNAVKSGFTGDVAYVVGVGAEYGAYVEFGTSKMEAQPYLFPAARTVVNTEFSQLEAQATTVGDLVRMVALAIEREAKRNAPVDTGNLQNSIEAFPVGAQA